MIEKDFGDWLSPMLVKEIRQGFRSRVFVLAFLLIQGFMIFCVLWGLVFSMADFTDQSSFFFWMIISIPLLLIMPSLGFGVIGSEIKANTIELLFLTRLSAWRIVAGKWTAIVAQTILIVCSVLPYMVLRYFIGGVNLLDDLRLLGWMLYWSAMLTALTIAISPFYRSMLAKLMLPVVTLIVIVVLANSGEFQAVTASRFGFQYFYLIAAVLGPLFLLLMFEIAVTRIAPPAENHSFRKRLLGFLILGAIALLNHFTRSTGFLMFLGVLLLLPVCITSLCEEVKPIPSIYLPFVKRGLLGRLAGALFYPGWPSGFLFTVAAFAAYLAIFLRKGRPLDPHTTLLIVSMAGALLMPLAVEKVFFKRLKKTGVVYFSIQAFMATAFLFGSTLSGTLPGWMELLSPLPTSAFFLALFDRIENSEQPLFVFVGGVVLLCTLVILLAKCFAASREIRSMERIARDTLMKPAPPEIAHASAA